MLVLLDAKSSWFHSNASCEACALIACNALLCQLVAKVYPPRASIAEVIDIASRFWADHPEEYIAIHCAYGALPGRHRANSQAKGSSARQLYRFSADSGCALCCRHAFRQAMPALAAHSKVFQTTVRPCFKSDNGHQCAGFNRTGFVLCAYLVQVCGLTVDEALASFAV